MVCCLVQVKGSLFIFGGMQGGFLLKCAQMIGTRRGCAIAVATSLFFPLAAQGQVTD